MSFCSVRNKNLRCQRAVVGLSILLVWMLLGAGNVSAQQAKRPITLEDLWKVKRLGKPSLSPDGKWAVVDVTSYSMDDNNSTTHLWLLATDGKTQKQLTNGKGESGGDLVAGRQIDCLHLQARRRSGPDLPHFSRWRRGQAAFETAHGPVRT